VRWSAGSTWNTSLGNSRRGARGSRHGAARARSGCYRSHRSTSATPAAVDRPEGSTAVFRRFDGTARQRFATRTSRQDRLGRTEGRTAVVALLHPVVWGLALAGDGVRPVSGSRTLSDCNPRSDRCWTMVSTSRATCAPSPGASGASLTQEGEQTTLRQIQAASALPTTPCPPSRSVLHRLYLRTSRQVPCYDQTPRVAIPGSASADLRAGSGGGRDLHSALGVLLSKARRSEAP